MKSMTGYGSADGRVGKGEIFVEIKSVNHRYCDISCKIPPKMNVLEPNLREAIQANIARGKVELFLKEKSSLEPAGEIKINIELAKKYREAIHKLSKTLGLKTSETNFFDIIDLKELVSVRERGVEFGKLWPQIGPIVNRAITNFNKMRSSEGGHLKKEQAGLLGVLGKLVNKFQFLSQKTVNTHKDRLCRRLNDNLNGSDIDEARLRTEIAIIIDKFDVTEELSRLKSHINQYRSLLNLDEPVGRSLDFLLQEMNREVNTLGSKANDGEISKHVVSAKGTLEKLREQVQNIE